MKRKELTKRFMLISILQKPLVSFSRDINLAGLVAALDEISPEFDVKRPQGKNPRNYTLSL